MNKKNYNFKEHTIKILSNTESSHNPLYANHVVIRFSPMEYIFEFHFIDPGKVEKMVKDNKKEIESSPITRIALSYEMAEKFFDTFKGTIEKIKKIKKGKND